MEFRPQACPLQGVTGAWEWAILLVEMLQLYRKFNCTGPPFTYPRIDRAWGIIAEPAPYDTTRRTLELLRVALDEQEGER